MRVLIDEVTGLTSGTEPDDGQLDALYGAPRLPWLRVNMVETVDGAATGPDGRSGSINNDPDGRVFHALRARADVVLVGAGTVRAEEYGTAGVPIVLVSRSGDLPVSLVDAPRGSVLMATCAAAPGLSETVERLGEDGVLVLGDDRVDLVALREALVERGWGRILSEGGPHLLTDMLAAGIVDEVCTSQVPRLVGGDHRRITVGSHLDVPTRLATLLEEDGTLLARWFVQA
ncbi:riboflavin biosynthesis pyrimidine reductase [Mumia flava]|uniref:Riboflavin biosynthesis pyrimidine reductase n=1 Tax=Mumia flava TaxID=1348852 RepID=A0A0B2BNU0_9ACTN|nr:dihydrofolate reductase family protein [Mumia flava]PJJ56531.1 riboflavin biosynthesis pyrimidine reductase [Mumia flava]